MTKTQRNRSGCTLDIRNHIVALMRTAGTWENIAGCRIRWWKADPFQASLCTPFNPLPLPIGGQSFMDGVLRELSKKQQRIFPYLLDLWFEEKKVLSIEWNATGATHTIGYRRTGEWEDQLLAIRIP
jgi:hypothetical protein